MYCQEIVLWKIFICDTIYLSKQIWYVLFSEFYIIIIRQPEAVLKVLKYTVISSTT